MDSKFKEAFECCLRRDKDVRGHGHEYPSGQTDKGGRWEPSDTEAQECCKSIRSPSRAYPWSLFKHCHSVKHVANLYGLDKAQAKELAKAVKIYKKNQGKDALDRVLFVPGYAELEV